MYTGDLNKDMSKGFIAFINEKHPNSLRLRICCHIALLENLVGTNMKRLKRQEIEEAMPIANNIISMSRHIKVRNMRQYKSENIHVYETYVFTCLGSVAVNSYKDYPKALEYFGKALNVAHQAHGDTNDIARVEPLIATVKSHADPNNKDLYSENRLKHLKSTYENEVEQNGESYPNTLLTGLAYARALKEEHYGVKSEKLMSLLAETSKQNHGQDHNITKQMEKFLYSVKSRHVTILSLLGEGEDPITFMESESGASHYDFVHYDGVTMTNVLMCCVWTKVIEIV